MYGLIMHKYDWAYILDGIVYHFSHHKIENFEHRNQTILIMKFHCVKESWLSFLQQMTKSRFFLLIFNV